MIMVKVPPDEVATERFSHCCKFLTLFITTIGGCAYRATYLAYEEGDALS